MDQLAHGHAWMAGQRIAFTGRLATMTRPEAAQLVHSLGGVPVVSVARSTSMLVVGQQGLPLRSDGKVTRNLRRARFLKRLGHGIEVLDESQWLARIQGDTTGEIAKQQLTAVEVTSILGISREQLRAWVRFGLIHPVASVHGISLFDFPQVAAAKRLLDLTRGGVSVKRLRRSLKQLERWLGLSGESFHQLAILERNGQLLVRMEEGHLADPGGQMHFEFPEEHPPSYQLNSQPRTPEGWFELGCELEDAGDLREALHAYRQALLLGGPSADISFNLANVLYATGQRAQASERYRQAVEIDPDFIEAWNNLGIVLAEMKQCDDAVWAYRKAIELDPQYADAHYNLADCLDRNGCTDDAREHWENYTRLDPASQWSEYARERLTQKSVRPGRRKRRRDSV